MQFLNNMIFDTNLGARVLIERCGGNTKGCLLIGGGQICTSMSSKLKMDDFIWGGGRKSVR